MRAARVVLGAALLLVAAASGASAYGAPAGPPVAPVVRVNGAPCVGAGDLARLLGGVQYWDATTRKLVIRAQGHRLTLTDGVPIALLDDLTLRLDAPVRSLGGELQVPLSLLPQLPRDSTSVRLLVDAGGTRVRVAPAQGYAGPPRLGFADGVTRVTLLTAHAAQARIVSRDREHFRIWLPGAPAGGAADTLPVDGAVRAMRRLPTGDGVTWEFALAPGTPGWSLATPAGLDAAVLEFGPGPAREAFAPEAPAGPRPLRVIVLDPGHGGDDAGVTVDGAVEKDLALKLAHALAAELQHRCGARVVLTRDADRALSQNERAEIANRARADLVLSLHFDGAPRTRAHGATAWCPPVADLDPGETEGGTLPVPWRDVACRWAGPSRALADAIAGALEARGVGPARVRETLPVALLGVNAAGLSLECATLTSPDDLARVTAPGGLETLAAAITDGVLAWRRHD